MRRRIRQLCGKNPADRILHKMGNEGIRQKVGRGNLTGSVAGSGRDGALCEEKGKTNQSPSTRWGRHRW